MPIFAEQFGKPAVIGVGVALQQQERTGERLGRLLLILGSIRRLDLGRALAELWQLPFIMITPETVAPAVAQRFPLEATLKFRAVPIRDDGTTLTVANSTSSGTMNHSSG